MTVEFKKNTIFLNQRKWCTIDIWCTKCGLNLANLVLKWTDQYFKPDLVLRDLYDVIPTELQRKLSRHACIVVEQGTCVCVCVCVCVKERVRKMANSLIHSQ